MLNTLLDINQIEAGSVKPEKADFPVNDLFDRLRDELTYHAHAAGLVLRVVPCALSIRSDRRLLEQMIRNLISNALKYTHSGKVLVGCRCRQGNLRIEIWDTGIGIPELNGDRFYRLASRWALVTSALARSLGEALPRCTRFHQTRARRGSVQDLSADTSHSVDGQPFVDARRAKMGETTTSQPAREFP